MHDSYYQLAALKYGGAAALTERQSRALEAFNRAADALAVSARLVPGEVQVLNNHALVHKRSAYRDWEVGEGGQGQPRLSARRCAPGGAQGCGRGRPHSYQVLYPCAAWPRPHSPLPPLSRRTRRGSSATYCACGSQARRRWRCRCLIATATFGAALPRTTAGWRGATAAMVAMAAAAGPPAAGSSQRAECHWRQRWGRHTYHTHRSRPRNDSAPATRPLARAAAASVQPLAPPSSACAACVLRDDRSR